MPLKRKRSDSHPAPSGPKGPRKGNNGYGTDEGGENENAEEEAVQQLGRLNSKEEVQQAMLILKEMQHQLLDEARRQRLAVEASDLQTQAESDEAGGFATVPNISQKRTAAPNGSNLTKKDLKNEANAVGVSSSSEGKDKGPQRLVVVKNDKLPLP